MITLNFSLFQNFFALTLNDLARASNEFHYIHQFVEIVGKKLLGVFHWPSKFEANLSVGFWDTPNPSSKNTWI